MDMSYWMGDGDGTWRLRTFIERLDEDLLRGEAWVRCVGCRSAVPRHLATLKPEARPVRTLMRLGIMSPLYLCARCVEGCDHGADEDDEDDVVRCARCGALTSRLGARPVHYHRGGKGTRGTLRLGPAPPGRWHRLWHWATSPQFACRRCLSAVAAYGGDCGATTTG